MPSQDTFEQTDTSSSHGNPLVLENVSSQTVMRAQKNQLVNWQCFPDSVALHIWSAKTTFRERAKKTGLRGPWALAHTVSASLLGQLGAVWALGPWGPSEQASFDETPLEESKTVRPNSWTATIKRRGLTLHFPAEPQNMTHILQNLNRFSANWDSVETQTPIYRSLWALRA